MCIAVQRISVSSIHSVTLCCAALCLVQLIIMSSTGAATSTTSGELQSGSSSATASDVAVVAATAAANENAQQQRTVESIVGAAAAGAGRAVESIVVHQQQQQQQLAKLTGDVTSSAALTVKQRHATNDDKKRKAEAEAKAADSSLAGKRSKIAHKATERGAGGSARGSNSSSEEEEEDDNTSQPHALIRGSFKAISDKANTALEAFKAAKIDGVNLLMGPLPESSRSVDPYRTFFDINNNNKLSKELEPLIKESEAAFRKQIKKLDKETLKELHMVVLKLLVTKPGAAAQEVHQDVVEDGGLCWGVLLHCTDTEASTFVPANADTRDLVRKLAKEKALTFDDVKRGLEIKKDLNKHFKNEQASAGDALFFKGDVAHYGPAVPAGKPERVMLYALFSIHKKHKNVDKEQIYPLGGFVKRLEKLHSKMKKKQNTHDEAATKYMDQAEVQLQQAKEYGKSCHEIITMMETVKTAEAAATAAAAQAAKPASPAAAAGPK